MVIILLLCICHILLHNLPTEITKENLRISVISFELKLGFAYKATLPPNLGGGGVFIDWLSSFPNKFMASKIHLKGLIVVGGPVSIVETLDFNIIVAVQTKLANVDLDFVC